MGVLVGLGVGIGLFLLVTAGNARPPAHRGRSQERTTLLIAQAGVEGLSPRQLSVLCWGSGAVIGLVVVVISGVLALGLVGGVACGRAPRAALVRRARTRQSVLREVWPDAVDDLASAVRAGLSLPEALGALSVRGPEVLRPAFARFGEEHRATGSFNRCLDRLAASLADPTADQVVETVRLAREVGGSDLGLVLRTLSAFLREEARTRAELETRQSWAVNGARMALVAPWAVLALLAAGSSATVDAYNRPAGVLVLGIGGGVSLLAYRLMRALGRLPEPPRVLRSTQAAT